MENENINFEKKSFKKSEFITLFASIYEHSDWVIKNIIKNTNKIDLNKSHFVGRAKIDLNKMKISLNDTHKKINNTVV